MISILFLLLAPAAGQKGKNAVAPAYFVPGGGDNHAGQCPVLGPGTIGTCIEACSGDSSCPQDQKCCSNGCGRTCQRAVSAGGGGSTVHPGQCPAPNGGFSTCIVTCTDDSSCSYDQKCCSTGCGRSCQRTTSPGGGVVHAGQCPALGVGAIGTCIEACTDDGSCAPNEKCCSNGCGRTCQRTATSGGGGGGTRPGQCPASNGGFGTCIEACTSDDSCPPAQKCCSNGCGRTCQAVAGSGGGGSGCLALPCAPISCPAGQQQMQYDNNGCPTCPRCNNGGGYDSGYPSNNGKANGITCSTNSDCRGNKSCVNGRCRPTNGKGQCQNGLCPAGQRCVGNICRVGY